VRPRSSMSVSLLLRYNLASKLVAILLAAMSFSCGGTRGAPEEAARPVGTTGLEITSPSFERGKTIPSKHTCDGGDSSPPLRFGPSPAGTKTLALVCDDPDAPRGTWVHWVIYNVPASARELLEGVPTVESLPDGSLQGKNDFGRIGYGGPCPPAGTSHRYFFKLYALDTEMKLKPGATKQELEGQLRGHVLAQGTLIGIYSRK
jgi:Raf kinase inhibitor-like YbhB/YbcL family protein